MRASSNSADVVEMSARCSVTISRAYPCDLVANPVELHSGTLGSDVMRFPPLDDCACEQKSRLERRTSLRVDQKLWRIF